MTSASTTEQPALEGRITEEALAVLRSRIGLEVLGARHGNSQCTRDSIENFTRGIGDVNPLYRDRRYAATSRWRGSIAHPTLLRYMGDSRDGRGADTIAADRLAPSGDPIAGVHGFYAGVEMFFTRPLCAGDECLVRGGLAGVTLKPSRMAGQAVHLLYDKVWWNQRGELLGVARDLHVRIERSAARSRKQKYQDGVPKSWTPDEIAEVDAYYQAEQIRGPSPRNWDEVALGDRSQPLVKGPYSVGSFLAFQAGTGLMRNLFMFVHTEAYQRRLTHPKAFPPNTLGVPDVAPAVHWDKELAERAGVPERYDAGAERIAWMSQAVTHWMGDDGFIERLRVSVRGFLYVGDAMWITCEVVDKYSRGGAHGVRLEIVGKNQRDEVVATGEADVLLPRDGAPPAVPPPEREPVSMFEDGGPYV